MKKSTIFVLWCLLVSIFALTACGSKDVDTKSKKYSLAFNDMGARMITLDWDGENHYGGYYLYLNFDEGVPNGTDWFLGCDQSWVEFLNAQGRVSMKSELVPFTFKNNENYDDREAHIYLNVPDGDPESSLESTVTVHQYGYEYYLGQGKTIWFKTNRSNATSPRLTINDISVNEIVEINWGDGSSDVITKLDKQYYTGHGHTISHAYSVSDTYKVKIRFAPEYSNNNTSIKFSISKGHGVEWAAQGNQEKWLNNDSKNISISYSENFGFDAHEY